MTLPRLLRIAPPVVAALWIAGVMRFRAVEGDALTYAALLAAAFALQIVVSRLSGPRRRVVLPEGTDPRFVAFLAAVITGGVALVLGGIFEGLLPESLPAPVVPWWLRTLWHGACAFGGSYCYFLARLVAGSGGGGTSSPGKPV